MTLGVGWAQNQGMRYNISGSPVRSRFSNHIQRRTSSMEVGRKVTTTKEQIKSEYITSGGDSKQRTSKTPTTQSNEGVDNKVNVPISKIDLFP